MKKLFKVHVLFPCDFGDKHGNYKTHKFEIESVHNYNYLSSAFSIEDNYKLNSNNAVQKLFENCRIDNQESKNSIAFGTIFKVERILFPYGISVFAELCLNEITALLNNIEKGFCTVVYDEDKIFNAKEEWVIYDKPIIIIENFELPKYKCMHAFLKRIGFLSELTIDEYEKNSSVCGTYYLFSNLIFIENEKSIRWNSFFEVLSVLIAQKNISGFVRANSKKVASSSGKTILEKEKICEKIHTSCAIFNEIYNKNIFREERQRNLYTSISKNTDLTENLNLVESAKNTADYFLASRINKRASKLNDTLFITGYVGLVLSFLSFIPFQLQNIVKTTVDIGENVKFFSILSGVVMFCTLCTLLTLLYRYFDNVSRWCKRTLLKSINWIKKNFIGIVGILLIICVILIVFSFFKFCHYFKCGYFDIY